MDALDRLKLADNTLVLFTSDNGPVLFDGYFDRSVEDANGHKPADGLRGWKYLVFEGGTRVPFIARWPGHVPAGVSDQMLCLSDMLATCAALAGHKLPKGVGPDSLNVLPVLLGKSRKSPRDTVMQQGVSGALAIRKGDWKFIPPNASAQPAGIGSGANPNDTRFKEAMITEPLLFHLKTDPGETYNLHERTGQSEGTRRSAERSPHRKERGTDENQDDHFASVGCLDLPAASWQAAEPKQTSSGSSPRISASISSATAPRRSGRPSEPPGRRRSALRPVLQRARLLAEHTVPKS